METIIAALITGAVTGAISLCGVMAANNKNQAIMQTKIDVLTKQVEKHNSVLERTYKLETDVSVLQNDVKTLYNRTDVA